MKRRASKTPYERMIAKVRIGLDCWLFEGALSSSGYGNVRIRIGNRWTCTQAHRVSYLHHKGEIPEGLEVRHMCDTRNCVNPKHLELGTHFENVNDIILRHRGANQYGPYVGRAAIAAATEDCPF